MRLLIVGDLGVERLGEIELLVRCTSHLVFFWLVRCTSHLGFFGEKTGHGCFCSCALLVLYFSEAYVVVADENADELIVVEDVEDGTVFAFCEGHF